MGTGYRGVKDIVSEFREQQWSAPRGAVAFKPAPNPALNKPLEGDSNQKRLLKILLEPGRTHAHTRKGERMLVTISGSGCLCVTESQCGYQLLCVCVSVCVPGITTQHFYFNQLLRSGWMYLSLGILHHAAKCTCTADHCRQQRQIMALHSNCVLFVNLEIIYPFDFFPY